MSNQSQVVVIGGGAAGFFGAINCAIHNPNLSITILEASKNTLTKVKISGGGRCNVTHNCFNIKDLVTYYPRGGKELRGAFSRFQPQDTIDWFSDRGVKLKTEADGRMFPITNNSQTIIDCLTQTAQQLSIKIITQAPVQDISCCDFGFNILLKSGKIITAKQVLIATGSNPLGYRWAKKLGHTIKSPVPSLFTFKINDSRLANLAGISSQNVEVKLNIKKDKNLTQQGAILITHWGVSGPAILKLSAWGARVLSESKYHLPLTINWLPGYNQEIIKQKLLELKNKVAKQKIINYNQFNLPKRLWKNLVKYCLNNPDKIWADISKKELEKLAIELTRGTYQIEGKGVFKEEFVTCGGVILKEIDFRTMMSKKCPNLYFAGEVIDIDGVTGGFNFQNAWTTGWLAGKSMSNEVISNK